MKGKIFLFLFALPFFGVGVWMTYSVGSNLADAWQMRSWQATEARLTSGGYTSHAGDDSTTYEAYATYTYTVGGRSYSNDRVGIAGGADNVGSYQLDTGRRLGAAFGNGQPIVVYVNPAEPAESIIDRNLRWSLIGFKSIFLLVFGGVGLGLLIYVFRSPKKKDPSDPAYRDAPWLVNDKWQTPTIRSNSKSTMYVTWGFAAFWNLISAPLPFVVYVEVLEKENNLALIGLLFPLVGLVLITWAIRQTREWRRFGPTPVTLDPYPGSIGGHVGGTIDVRAPYDSAARFKLTLTGVNSYVSGSGKNRSRREKAVWQDTQYAHAEPRVDGTRVTFRFGVPAGQPESDAEQSGDRYHLWRLNLKAELPGADLDRDFEIPVYATGAVSTALPERIVESVRVEQDKIDEQSVKERMQIDYSAAGRSIRYPTGRNVTSALGAFVVGALFAGAGWFIVAKENETLFGVIFGGVGALIALGALYLALNSLQVYREGSHLKAVRRVLGIPVSRKSVRGDDVVRISKDSKMQTQSGRTHVMHYSIYVHDGAGQKVCVGEGFKGAGEADAAIRLITREFSLSPRDGLHTDAADDGFDALAAD